MLEELALPYEIDACLPHAESAKALNPSGKIPVLVEPDGGTLLDSIAIVQYLADQHQRFTFAAGTRERAVQDSFTQFAADDLETPLWTAAKHSFVLPADKRVRAVKPTCNWEFGRSLQALEARLGDGPYLMGEEFTVADLIMTNCILWGRMAKFDPPPKRVEDYAERVSSRPAHQRAIEQGSF